MRRLYVSTITGQSIVWVDGTMAEASLRFSDAKVATPNEIRAWWESEGLGSVSVTEICERYKVSRQIYHAWRRKAGVPIFKRKPLTVDQLREIAARVEAGSPVEIEAANVELTEPVLRRKLRALGVSIPRAVVVAYTDENLVELATGRSWAEMAEVAGQSVAHLQRRIYGNKDLAQRVRAVMLRSNSVKRKVVVNAE